jgi:hypothetical protein
MTWRANTIRIRKALNTAFTCKFNLFAAIAKKATCK